MVSLWQRLALNTTVMLLAVATAGCGAGNQKNLSPVPTGSLLHVPVQDGGTVRITAVGCGGTSTGAGWIFRREYVMTAAHVVAGSTSITATLAVANHLAHLIYFNAALDVAILFVPTLQTPTLATRPLPIAPGYPQRGSIGYLIGGNPYGDGYGSGPPYGTVGVGVRGVESMTTKNIYGTANITRTMILLSASFVEGDSGAPIVNTKGQVIGMALDTVPAKQPTALAIPATTLISISRTPRTTNIGSGPCIPGH